MDTKAEHIKNRSISLAPVLRQFVTPFRQFRVIQAILSKERKTVQTRVWVLRAEKAEVDWSMTSVKICESSNGSPSYSLFCFFKKIAEGDVTILGKITE